MFRMGLGRGALARMDEAACQDEHLEERLLFIGTGPMVKGPGAQKVPA